MYKEYDRYYWAVAKVFAVLLVFMAICGIPPLKLLVGLWAMLLWILSPISLIGFFLLIPLPFFETLRLYVTARGHQVRFWYDIYIAPDLESDAEAHGLNRYEIGALRNEVEQRMLSSIA